MQPHSTTECPQLCACGCGQPLPEPSRPWLPPRQFIKGHVLRTPESKAAQAAATKAKWQPTNIEPRTLCACGCGQPLPKSTIPWWRRRFIRYHHLRTDVYRRGVSSRMKRNTNGSVNTPEKFWNNVYKTEGCWIWIGHIRQDLYGELSVHSHKVLAHRLSWIIHFGPIPDAMFICHRCDFPGCVNPHHLFLGTPLDNSRDMTAKGRHHGPTKVIRPLFF